MIIDALETQEYHYLLSNLMLRLPTVNLVSSGFLDAIISTYSQSFGANTRPSTLEGVKVRTHGHSSRDGYG